MAKQFWIKQPCLRWIDLTGRFELMERPDGTLAAIKILNKERGSNRLMMEVLDNDR